MLQIANIGKKRKETAAAAAAALPAASLARPQSKPIPEILISFPLYAQHKERLGYNQDFMITEAQKAFGILTQFKHAAREKNLNFKFKAEFWLYCVPQTFGEEPPQQFSNRQLVFSETKVCIESAIDSTDFRVVNFNDKMTASYQNFLKQAVQRDLNAKKRAQKEKLSFIPSQRLGGELVDLIKIDRLINAGNDVAHLVLDTTTDIIDYEALINIFSQNRPQFYMNVYAESLFWTVVNKIIFLPCEERPRFKQTLRSQLNAVISRSLILQDQSYTEVTLYNKVFIGALRSLEWFDENYVMNFEVIKNHIAMTSQIVPNKTQKWMSKLSAGSLEHVIPEHEGIMMRNPERTREIFISSTIFMALTRKYLADFLGSTDKEQLFFKQQCYNPSFELMAMSLFFERIAPWMHAVEERQFANRKLFDALERFAQRIKSQSAYQVYLPRGTSTIPPKLQISPVSPDSVVSAVHEEKKLDLDDVKVSPVSLFAEKKSPHHSTLNTIFAAAGQSLL